MFAGYMRSKENPGHMAKLLAIMCKYEGIELIYMTPEDVNVQTGKVIGKINIDKKWVKVESKLPGFIDINPNYFNYKKHTELIRYLNKHSILSSDKRMPLPKDQLQETFKYDKEVREVLIPSKKVNVLKDVEEFIDLYQAVVLKPIYSNKGKDVYILKKEGSKFLLGYSKQEELINWEEFKQLFYERNFNQGFVVQKCIMSRTPQGD